MKRRHRLCAMKTVAVCCLNEPECAYGPPATELAWTFLIIQR